MSLIDSLKKAGLKEEEFLQFAKYVKICADWYDNLYGEYPENRLEGKSVWEDIAIELEVKEFFDV